MEKIKAGIIGFGRVAGGHLRTMRETGLYDVVGVCDITESRREEAVAEGLRATGDLDAFLGRAPTRPALELFARGGMLWPLQQPRTLDERSCPARGQ
ncbi:MAG: hypothetical protein OXH16_13600 [Gemmatimonadetes bacterium]|nr:hypothetical protein [Gemmatimonadota bacterium]